MIRQCLKKEREHVYTIINDAARSYHDAIPGDRWKTPYMSMDELQHEMDDGVIFWCYQEEDEIVGVMGIQDVKDVTLIRHAYVRSSRHHQGIGTKLLLALRSKSSRPMLVGTWAGASWAVGFYEKHGFRLVTTEEKNTLLKKYWDIPERQVETSVVLADGRAMSCLPMLANNIAE